MATPAYYPVKGGTETIVRSLSIELSRIGITTDVMTLNMDQKWKPKWRGKIEKQDGITVFKIAALNWLPIAHSNRITFGINAMPVRFTNILKNYDVIHFHEDLTFAFFSFFVRKPKIFHLHGGTFNYNALMLKRLANLYICITKEMEKRLVARGIAKSKIAYLPNGVDANLFRPHGRKQDNLLLFVGRLGWGKGLHLLLKSLRYLEKPVHLVIIGPPGPEPEYHQKMLFSIEKENQKGKHRITYLGALERHDVIEWYQKASIFVQPSYWEGFPVTTLEALSCETPVVATPVGGISDFVQNGKNGILIPPDDPVAIADAIRLLLEDEKTRIKFGQEGRNLVIECFSVEMVVRKLCRIYEQLVNSLDS